VSTEHRVVSHLGVDAQAYDAAIRRWIPGYEAMVGTIIEMVGELEGDPVVVDLGTGTGALARAILDGVSRARAVMIDIDPNMLALAGQRVAKHGARAELRRASFDDELPPCDAVVASLALHHVPELADKQKLYARIYRALRPRGVFLMGDATVHENGPAHRRIYRQWEAGMAEAGISHEQAAELFAQWAREDRYHPLAAELNALAAAGFTQPECFWKRGAMTVYGGFK
jgi:ubiquinone/menaquinone biosynthesis C-methylase UbiE